MNTLYTYVYTCGNCGKKLVKQIPKGMTVERFADILEEDYITCNNCECSPLWY